MPVPAPSMTFAEPLIWEFDGVPVEMAGTRVEFSWDEDVTDIQLIGGRTVKIKTLYCGRNQADSPRTTGLCTVSVQWPRVSREFFTQLLGYREFGQAFTLHMTVFDPDQPVLCVQDRCPVTRRPRLWAPHRWIADDASWKVHTRASPTGAWTEETTAQWDRFPQDGYVRWRTALPQGTQVGMTYAWAPKVRVFDITPNQVSGETWMVYKPQVTMRETD